MQLILAQVSNIQIDLMRREILLNLEFLSSFLNIFYFHQRILFLGFDFNNNTS